MKYPLLPVALFLCSICFAQEDLKPVSNDPAPISVDKSQRTKESNPLRFVSAEGHWIDHDPKTHQMMGPSTSSITCTTYENTCTEDQANLTHIGAVWVLSADHVEYTIDRWNDNELVAHKDPENTAMCKLRITLKFDFKLQKVYWLQSLNEPIDESAPKLAQDMCSVAGMSLELRDGKGFSFLDLQQKGNQKK